MQVTPTTRAWRGLSSLHVRNGPMLGFGIRISPKTLPPCGPTLAIRSMTSELQSRRDEKAVASKDGEKVKCADATGRAV